MSLNLFVFRVLVARKESSLQSWRRWLDKDLSSRPYRWLRPDFVPPSPYLIRPPSVVLVQPALVDAHFRKAWMPFFRREGRDLVTPEAFLDFVGSYLKQASLSSPVLTGDYLHATALGLAWILRLAEDTGRWLEGLLDAYITMIPKEAVMRLPCSISLVSLMGP